MIDFTNGNTMIIICAVASLAVSGTILGIWYKAKHVKKFMFIPVLLSAIGMAAGLLPIFYGNQMTEAGIYLYFLEDQMFSLGVFMYSFWMFVITLPIAVGVALIKK